MLAQAIVASSNPTPAEEIAAALDHVTALHGLPRENRLWLAQHGTEFRAKAGDLLFEEGVPAEEMILILQGEIHVRHLHGGPMALFIGRAAQITGLLPFSRMSAYGGQGIVISPLWALTIPHSMFPEMLAAIPSMAQRSVSALLDRVREVTRIEQQAEKLTALGKLAANLAHELNNPASAARRAASNLVTLLRDNRASRLKLMNLCLSEEQVEALEEWEARILARHPAGSTGACPSSATMIADEEKIRAWLQKAKCTDAAKLAGSLADQCVTVADLNELREKVGAEAIPVLLQYFTRFLRSSWSAKALADATSRISDLVGAVKDYSNMDRATILDVNVPTGLDATLQMFRSRMNSVEVERDYEPNLPSISACGGELNQVWSAIIENALDAMDNKGRIKLVCRSEGQTMLVEIWDCGPGIPTNLRERIFEPFFTTKPPGSGLGLGLDQAMRIVRMHCGEISVESEPGCTCFRVRLPFEQFQAY